MNLIEKYKDQHKQIISIINEIKGYLNRDQVISQNTEIRKMLSDFAGKLKFHLITEDKFLYPELLKSQDENIRLTARQFMNEMGNIYNNFNAYLEKWPNSNVIKRQPDDFIAQTKEIFNTLFKRIDKEDRILYALIADL